MANLDQLVKQQYLNLETFRKSGVGVKTPVWFVMEGDTVFIHTLADSGKAKRIRNNGQVNIAPCKANGDLLGDWIPAAASDVQDEEAGKKVDRMLDKKYGLMKKLFGLFSSTRGKKYTVLEVKLRNAN